MRNWSETDLWRPCYSVGDVFMEYIRTCNSHTTISDVCVYLNIIDAQVHPFMAKMFQAYYYIYHQNNAHCHTGRIVGEWFEEHFSDFQVMFWLPNSPDTNPVEHLCSHASTLQCAEVAGPVNEHLIRDTSNYPYKLYRVDTRSGVKGFEDERWSYVILNR